MGSSSKIVTVMAARIISEKSLKVKTSKWRPRSN